MGSCKLEQVVPLTTSATSPINIKQHIAMSKTQGALSTEQKKVLKEALERLTGERICETVHVSFVIRNFLDNVFISKGLFKR
jgi:hypothetical protein